MTGSYLTSITPDSLSGLIFGLEGIEKTVVILNGPTGCKFYHAAISDDQNLRQRVFDPLHYPVNFYFGQSRVPCTYLDKRDYIYGSREKLEELLTFVRDQTEFQLAAVVNSPGASLIGDNLEQIVHSVMGDRPTVLVETPGFSKSVWNGYDRICRLLTEQFAEAQPRQEKTVNLLGLSIFHKYYQGDLRELKRLLGLCGITVNCALCCGCSLEEIRQLPRAALNVVLYPEYGMGTARLLQERFGMDWVSGLPMGFAATERWITTICAALGCDPAPALLESEQARARAYFYISRINSITGLPKGVKAAVHGTCSQCRGLTEVLVRYFGMQAVCVTVLDDPADNPEDYEALCQLLREGGMESALEQDILQTDAAMVFADANILAKLRLRNQPFTGVEISLPTFGYVDVVPKTHLGLAGSLLLCEQVLNGLPF